MERTALVTGAGKGIGRAISLALAREGIRVALISRTETDIQRLASEIQATGAAAFPVACDVTKPESVTEAIDRIRREFGSVNILINNAGASGSHKFLDHDDRLWHQMIDVNLNSAYYVTKAVCPTMIEGRWGRIINIASISSKVGAKYIAAYTAAKHGVLGLTRALAAEFAPYGITVNAICPGYVDTPMTDRSVANIATLTGMSVERARTTLAGTSPQNRLISPEEVAGLVVMLVGESARGINGQAINIDGGAVMS